MKFHLLIAFEPAAKIGIKYGSSAGNNASELRNSYDGRPLLSNVWICRTAIFAQNRNHLADVMGLGPS